MARPVPLRSNPLIGVPEAAKRLRMSAWSVRRALESGALKGHRSGRVWKVVEADLTRFGGAQQAPVVNATLEPWALIGVTVTLDINGVQVPARITGVKQSQ